jgi:hypothetical protein
MFKLVAVSLIFVILLFLANTLTIVDTAKTLIYLMVGLFGMVGFWYAITE